MRVSSVKLKLIDSDVLKAEADIEFEREFVVHGVKIVQLNGRLVVCMPARKVRIRCGNGTCGHRNDADARFCNKCGGPVEAKAWQGRKIIDDVCHPICSSLRNEINECVLQEYERRLQEEAGG